MTLPSCRLTSGIFVGASIRLLKLRCLTAVGAILALSAATGSLKAQAPVALPSTATLLAGGANAGATGISGKTLPASGAACYPGSPYTATDANGDGCPGPYTMFSADFRGGVAADAAGNVYVIESTESLVRRIDARSGVVTTFAGGASTFCGAASQDGYGDGCPFATTKFSSPRGGWVDPYGNVLVAGYSSSLVNVLCNAISPLCPGTTGHKQIGSMYRVAGCVGSATAAGTAEVGATAGTAGDGGLASPNGNLSGDASDWGAASSTSYSSCTNNSGVDQPRGVSADKYGNVYIADTANARWRVVVGPPTFTLPNGTVLTNPIANVIKLNPTYSSVTATSAWGHIYPLLGGFASANNGGTAPPTTSGVACVGSSGGSTLDTIGDGCPFYENTNSSSTSSTLGAGLDGDGNPILMDQSDKVIRVLYLGGTTSAAAIQKANNNPSLAITQGYIYPIVGLGGASLAGISYAPQLGTATQINTSGSKMALGPGGNLWFSDFGKNSAYMFDVTTGYVRNVLVSGTPCATTGPNNDSVGDGCSNNLTAATPTTPFSFGGGGDGLGITFTPEGDLILGDITNSLIRRVTATDLAPAQVGTSLAQTVAFHGAAGTTGMTAAALGTSPDISVGAVTCAAAANADGTLDCSVPVTFAPVSSGQRSTAMTVAATGVTGTGNFPVAGLATGSALVADNTTPAVTTKGTLSSAVSLALDGSGDLFTMDSGAGAFTEIAAVGSTATLSGTLPASPYQIATDNHGDIYATGSGATSLTELTPTSTPGTYTTSTVSYTPGSGTAAPRGIVADRQGNVFVADATAEAVYELPAGTANSSGGNPVLIASGFSAVGELAIDGAGNLFVADTGAGKVFRVLAGSNASTAFASSVNPTHIAADTAGDLYIADATARTVTEYPVSGAGLVVYSSTGTITGIAVDGAGVLYETESGAAAANVIARNALSYNFGTTSPGSFAATITNAGNMNASGYNQTDSQDFQLVAGSSNGCNLASTQATGNACTVTGTFSPQAGTGVVSDALTFLPATSTVGSLTLSGTKNGSADNTTTIISAPTPANPVYAASGTEVTFTVNVAAATGTASGAVAVTVDSNAAVNYNLNSSGQASIPLSGLASGAHQISASYASQNGFTGSSTASPTSFSIAQASTTAAWTPTTTTQQYSAAIGTGVLNATATSNGTPVSGAFVYAATPSGGGSAIPIQSASYLPIGTYSLSATFVPTDSVNFNSSTASVASYTVTQASTVAAVGATQMLVAGDGTGNFTTVQSAVNALPSTGGSVYIKPGTYNGFITVVTSNVSLRGLGGDPTQVNLTHSAGAFGSSYPYTGEFTAANSNGAQLPAGSTLFNGDQGSATLVVAKGVNTTYGTTTTTPNSFYAENLSLINTYDSDTSTTTTTYEPSANGTCTVNAGPPMTYSALFNSQQLCASQALAVWIVSDLTVMNNVYTTSLQDTIYAGSQGSGSNGYVPARQYWFRGKVTGDIDYIFGDAAAVFDYPSIYTAFHGSTATGTETIEAQNKARQTGTAGDYLSGYVVNGGVLTSQAPGMTNLYFGRPYGTFSTWIMLNSYVDQVNPIGYIEFSGDSNLPTSTYAEYNNLLYTDPATGSADLNGVAYVGSGGNSGSGVTGTRETTSTDPGTPEASNTIKTSLTQAQAQAYFATNFLSQTVPSAISSTTNWNPTAAMASYVNAFVPTAPLTVANGSSVTILLRPQTPGLGAVTNGVWTIPTGTYTLSDTYSGNTTTIASGTLDASGEAYVTTSTLTPGTHNLSWTYSGDSNFAGSTTASAYVLAVLPTPTTTTLANTGGGSLAYGQAASITATVAATSGSTTPTGTVTLTIDGSATLTSTLSNGVASFAPALTGGTHSLSAAYNGSTSFGVSTTSSNLSLTVSPASLTITASCANRVFDTANSCSASVSGYQYSDTASTVFSAGPSATAAAVRSSPAGNYTATATATLSTSGSANYVLSLINGSFSVSGGAPQAIIFMPLPNFVSGASYQLTAHATSGLPVTYTVVSGNASVSGSTLTVSGPGLVTVQALQNIDPTGDYAAATPVSRSFTAQ
jgi:pectin methylesterase-like acyl-CoA thioesterase